MKLRKLELKDAEYMLGWMHDDNVVHFMGTNFAEKTIDDCRNFIKSSWNDENNLNLAVVNDNDRYMGTVSLKHINSTNRTAEFAITVCADAMGKGYSKYGMQKILEMGIKDLKLERIYWCVSKLNERAVKFYDKCGYKRICNIPNYIKEPYGQNDNLIWYLYN